MFPKSSSKMSNFEKKEGTFLEGNCGVNNNPKHDIGFKKSDKDARLQSATPINAHQNCEWTSPVDQSPSMMSLSLLKYYIYTYSLITSY